MSAAAAIAAGAAACLLARPAPAPPASIALKPSVVPSAAAAVSTWLGGASGVVAFGEVHQDTSTTGTRPALARFTDEILPALAPRASHLIVETWITTGACGQAETQVTEDIARTTERPKETESEIVRLLRRAKELRVAPHVLAMDCASYEAMQSQGGVDYDRVLALTKDHLETAIRQALALPRPPERPLVLVYGGALHNDLSPARALAAYSFGPAVFAATRGDYREVDLYVPELVERTPALRKEAWYRAWRAFAHPADVVVLPRSARSLIVVYPRGR
ncbi:MAG TPA: hypothetical protein VHK47_12245 [Polyangia bacterium]|nr:hypothetical protein [Polyangia bacterium]